MPIRKLDHINICTPRLAETMRFYEDVLGMVVSLPPGETDHSRGAWILDRDGAAVLHLSDASREMPGDTADTVRPKSGTGIVHHVAFEAEGHDEMLAHLRTRGIDPARNEVPSVNLRQLFLRDPNDVLIELNFRGA